MKKLTIALILAVFMLIGQTMNAQESLNVNATEVVDSSAADVSVEEMIGDEDMAELAEMAATEIGMHQQLKTKFIEGNPRFMSLVAFALIIGLALCIERIIYLTRSEINTKKLLSDIEKKIESQGISKGQIVGYGCGIPGPVTDDGRVNYDNAHTLWGTKPVYRTISCSVVSDMTETQNI